MLSASGGGNGSLAKATVVVEREEGAVPSLGTLMLVHVTLTPTPTHQQTNKPTLTLTLTLTLEPVTGNTKTNTVLNSGDPLTATQRDSSHS